MDMNTEKERRQTILLVEDDGATLPLLKALLNRLGYRVITAIDEKDVLDNIPQWLLETDLLLLNQGMPTQDVLAAGRRIRQHLSTDGNLPVVVIAHKYGKDMEGKDERDGQNDWITYLEDSEQLESLLGRLLN
jgi:CheY-like chemotaxis protein